VHSEVHFKISIRMGSHNVRCVRDYQKGVTGLLCDRERRTKRKALTEEEDIQA
jgi:hypothetical protein